ncbi:MAG: hypothetical protein SRB2_00400 [Desulfobacteraceae bacterium Eth-SRB2]|nr:MAG: hypothetical protein SRB2_00400 [Desulfobacteraceae bacterium Eth-SRB2]
MRKIPIHIAGLILFLLLFIGFFGTARAEQNPDQIELKLLTLINQARWDPLAVAGSFGLDPNQVLSDLPELSEILTHGLPALVLNPQLYNAALAHTRDMLDNNYYGKISPDGRSPYDRVVENGYDPVVTGETSGILAFYNFIGPDTAVQILFKNMFLDELNPEREEPRNILNPELNEVGIGIGTGAMYLDSGNYNVYLATCDFASSDGFTMENAEWALLHLINQARANPLQVAESLGVNPDQLLGDLPELCDVLTQGLPPVGVNQDLQRTAREHTYEMIDHRYLNQDSINGNSFEERIRENGYDSLALGESLGITPVEQQAALEDAVQKVFKRLFLAELDKFYPIQRNILNPKFSEVGIGLGELNPEPNEYFSHSFMVTCDFGSPAVPTGAYLMGLIYTDMDGDGLYTPGEGMPGVDIHIDNPHMDFEMTSDRTGGFQLLLGPGATRMVLWPRDAYKEFWVEIEQDNARFEYRN